MERVPRGPIRELMIHLLEVGHNIGEATKIVSFMKGKGSVHYNTVTRWFKTFCSGRKNFENQARSGRFPSMHSEAVLQDIHRVALREYQRIPASHSWRLWQKHQNWQIALHFIKKIWFTYVYTMLDFPISYKSVHMTALLGKKACSLNFGFKFLLDFLR